MPKAKPAPAAPAPRAKATPRRRPAAEREIEQLMARIQEKLDRLHAESDQMLKDLDALRGA